MLSYYKCVRLDGTDFYSGTVQWAPPEGHEGEWIVHHPTATKIGTSASSYLSVSTVPTDCVGMEWPCRLFEVEAVGDVEPDHYFRTKVVGLEFKIVRELDSHIALGPLGEQVAALIDRAARLTGSEMNQLSTAWAGAVDAAWGISGTVARGAAMDAAADAVRDIPMDATADAAMDATTDAAMDAAADADWGLLVRDLISTEHYDTLTRPWRTVIGPIHPDDPDIHP